MYKTGRWDVVFYGLGIVIAIWCLLFVSKEIVKQFEGINMTTRYFCSYLEFTPFNFTSNDSRLL